MNKWSGPDHFIMWHIWDPQNATNKKFSNMGKIKCRCFPHKQWSYTFNYLRQKYQFFSSDQCWPHLIFGRNWTIEQPAEEANQLNTNQGWFADFKYVWWSRYSQSLKKYLFFANWKFIRTVTFFHWTWSFKKHRHTHTPSWWWWGGGKWQIVRIVTSVYSPLITCQTGLASVAFHKGYNFIFA